MAQDHLAQAPLGRGVQRVEAVGRLQQRGQRARRVLGLARHQPQSMLAVKARAPDEGQQFLVRLQQMGILRDRAYGDRKLTVQQQVGLVTTRPGSRAEQLWGQPVPFEVVSAAVSEVARG